MRANLYKLSLLLAIILLTLPAQIFAQDKIEGVWYNAEKTSKIKVYKATNGKFYGKIVWLKEPTVAGKPRVDANNPDAKKRTNPIMGMTVLKGLEKDDDAYDDGEIYDPKNGKTYSCKAKLNGKNLDLRGYVGISLIGRTSTWTKAE